MTRGLIAPALLATFIYAWPAFADSRIHTVCELEGRLDKFVGSIITVRGAFQDFYHGSGLTDERCPKAILPISVAGKADENADLREFYVLMRGHGLGTPIYGRFTGRVIERAETILDGTVVQIPTLELHAAHDVKVLPTRRPWQVRPQ